MEIRVPLILCALALVFLAGTAAARAGSPPVSTAPSAGMLPPEWSLELVADAVSCTVTIDCRYSPDVSCTSANNQCSTSGECVVCDGVEAGCCEVCTQDCRTDCDIRWMICLGGCSGNPVCEDRCWSNRDICYRSGCGCYQ